MKNIISFNRAVQLSLILFGLFMLFHLAIIAGIVLFDIVPIDFLWGGQMETRQQLLGFEVISLLIMTACFLLVLIRSGRIHLPRLWGATSVALWVLFVLFLLNTLGNVLAKTNFERYFSIVTFVLSVLCLRLAIERQKEGD